MTVIKFTELVPSYKITKLGFRNRFSFAEKIAIEEAAKTDSAVSVILKDLEAATYIDITRPDTILGMSVLVQKGLITEERKLIILSPPVTPEEQFRG